MMISILLDPLSSVCSWSKTGPSWTKIWGMLGFLFFATFSTISITFLGVTSLLLSALYSSTKETSMSLSWVVSPPESSSSIALTTPLLFMALRTTSSPELLMTLSMSASFPKTAQNRAANPSKKLFIPMTLRRAYLTTLLSASAYVNAIMSIDDDVWFLLLRCVLTTSILYLKVTVHVNQPRLSSWQHRLLGYPVAPCLLPVEKRKLLCWLCGEKQLV